MARPKLTSRQKNTLRRGALRRLRAGQPRGHVIDWIGRRFRLTRTAARWHFERLYKVAPLPGELAAVAKVANQGSSRTGAGRRKVGAPGVRGNHLSLTQVIRSLPVRALKRALEAGKLLPKLEECRKRELELSTEDAELSARLSELLRKRRDLRRELGAVRLRRRDLDRRISSLTTGGWKPPDGPRR